ncbi:type II secretion system secretin GspD [Methylocapsa polymorpha]|uniref:Type II secretion system secretin GspD n=1 Tax=Methylocapsa polymorpha TaxID=3080828 RepID=A0ABZ0HS69_9HYPH|nr:type II secretion system secretin GspD [Methylocapsa sp. RX1]
MLAACGSAPIGVGANDLPDALDHVRAIDLQPRFPRSAENVNTGAAAGAADRPLVYYGSGGSRASRSADSPGSGDGVELNFENTPVTTVAKVILGDILNLGYTIDPRVQGSISLSSGRPIPKNHLLFVLESALRTSNTVLVHDVGGYHIVPADEAIGSGSVDRTDQDRRLEPGYGVTVIPLQHVSAPTIMKLLEGFAAKAGSVRADAGNNLLVVVGNGVERRSAVDTVLSFDVDWMRGQSVGVFPVHNTTPEPLIAELEKILDSGEAGMSQNLVKLQAVSRLNAILVVARKPELLQAAGTWIGRLDGSTTASTGVKVYRVRYGDAKQIAKLLSDLFIGGGGGGALDSAANQIAPGAGSSSLSAAERLTGGPPATTTTTATAQTQTQTQPQNPFGALRGGADGQDNGAAAGGSALSNAPVSSRSGSGPALLAGVRIMADAANNSVVIYANQESYRIIERALNQLDRPRMQVAIDLTIAEVTLNDELNYGVQFFLGHTLGGVSSSGTSTVSAGAGPVGVMNTVGSLPLSTTQPGFNLLLGSKYTPQVIINALHDYTTTKVLSNPSLVVIDNQVATLTVGDQVPISTGSATVLTTNNTVVNTIDYKNTGIILRILPRINSNGNVLLDVEQEISQCQNCQPNNPNLTPTISERKVKSSILVADSQTVLLAGLIQDNQNGDRAGIPGLDQIPVFGNAFVNNYAKQGKRTELIIFIRPQIIRDGVDASFVAEELRSKMRGDKITSYHPPGAVSPNP